MTDTDQPVPSSAEQPADPVRKTIPLPPELLGFIESEAASRGNDSTSLVREILFRWARRHGYESDGEPRHGRGRGHRRGRWGRQHPEAAAAIEGAPEEGAPENDTSRCGGGRGRWRHKKRALRFQLMAMLALLGGPEEHFRGRGGKGGPCRHRGHDEQPEAPTTPA